jgi:hypothetical protein
MASENIHQVYIANPITTNASTDLMYFGQSPYGIGNDAAMTFANFSAQFSSIIALTPVGSSPNADGATISGSTFTLQPANATMPGLVSATTQTFAGAKTFQLGLTANSGPINLGTDSGTDTIDIGTGGSGRLIALGNNLGTTEITQTVGTGGWLVDGSGGANFSIGPSITTGAITIGGTGQSGTLTLGSSNTANIVNIANGTGPTTTNIAANSLAGSVNIGTNATTATINIGGAAQTGTITLGSTSGTNTVLIASGAGTGLVDIATGATNPKTVNIATGNVSNTVDIGSLTGTSSLTLNAGSGGINVPSLTAESVVVTNSNNQLSTATLTNGQLVIGSTGLQPVVSTITAGANISVTNGAGSITIAATGSAGFVWNNVATATQALANNNGYITNDGATLVTYTLPATAAQGTIIEVAGFSAGGWTIAQNASQEIFFGNQHTTIGTGGSLSSTNQYDQIKLLCVVANTSWVVRESIGNITFV